MSDDENQHRIANDAKKEVVREAMQVGATKIALADGKRLGAFRRLQHEPPQLAVKIVRKLLAGDPLTASIPIIVCTALGDPGGQRETALRRRGIGYVPKPFDVEDLLRELASMLARSPN